MRYANYPGNDGRLNYGTNEPSMKTSGQAEEQEAGKRLPCTAGLWKEDGVSAA